MKIFFKCLYCSVMMICFFSGVNLYAQNYVSKIDSYKIYNDLKGKPLSNKFSNIESVKVIYDLKSKRLYFFNSTKIRLHFDFVNEYVGYDKGLQQFNEDNYSRFDKNRDYLLGNLNHLKGTKKWIFELAASDQMSVLTTEFFFKTVAKSFFSGDVLQFYLNNREKIDAADKNLYKIPTVKSDYIFDEIQYQAVVEGTAFGILKKYKISDLKTMQPHENEIIVLDGTPDILPNVRGIIVNELQTPLSHLVILGRNRKIPILAYKKAFTDLAISNLVDQNVALTVESDSFDLKKSVKKAIFKDVIKPRKLAIDSTIKSIVDLEKLSKSQVQAIGSKAQNMAFLISISKKQSYKTPENAMAIPFYFYRKHIQNKEISSMIDFILENIKKDNSQEINLKLKELRKKIMAIPINKNLILSLHDKLSSQKDFKNFRFRSSTNAEDIDGFNGAGLYDSKTGIIGDSVKSFEKAIKTVWASVWSEAAFWERNLFKIDQKSIAMGVLVHRSFPDEVANGVVISSNIMRDNFSGMTVNIQKGENSVVKPAAGEICEQFTIYDFETIESAQNFDVDYVSHSNLNNNKPLLSTAEINNLFKTSKYIESKMQKIWRNVKPIDLEFKYIGATRQLYVKQVRVFNK